MMKENEMRFKINDIVKYSPANRIGGKVFKIDHVNQKVSVKWPDGSKFKYKETLLEFDHNFSKDLLFKIKDDELKNLIDKICNSFYNLS